MILCKTTTSICTQSERSIITRIVAVVKTTQYRLERTDCSVAGRTIEFATCREVVITSGIVGKIANRRSKTATVCTLCGVTTKQVYMMQFLECVIICSCEFCLPYICTVITNRCYSVILQTSSRIRWRIVVLFGVRQVCTQINLKFEVLYGFPFCICICYHTGIAGRSLDIIQVGYRITNYSFTIPNEQVLTDRSLRVVIRTVSIVDGLCGRGNECRHPTVSCPL